MMTDLQDLVDDLSASLGRPVGVDDRRFRAMAYSSHVDGVDPVRLASILQREAPREVTKWLEALGIAAIDDFARLPANPALGMAARVCVPLRLDRSLLGYLWLIDEPQPLSTKEIDTSLRFAADLSAALYRVTRLEGEDRERAQELQRCLLGLAPGDPAGAARELLSRSMLASASRYVTIAVAPDHEAGEAAPDSIRVRLAAAVEQLRRTMPPRHLRMLVDAENVIAVTALDRGDGLESYGVTLLAAVTDSLQAVPSWTATIGVGGPREQLEELRGSYAEACRAIALGRTVPGLGPLVRWDRLGAYRTLSVLRYPDGGEVPLPDSLRRLLTCSDAATLVPTLEQYLEHAGEARSAAADLFIHKSSLYQRIRRIEEVCGVDLSSGDDRLELHVGLRLWRMSGAAE